MFPRAKKSLGQNFLADASYAGRIVRALGPRGDETIVEIGPGRGALTERLVGVAGRVVAVEFDRDLAALLRERYASREDFSLVEADALEVDLCETIAPARVARVVANLPYNIATAILQRLIRQRRCLREMILMLQREVVERITAPPGSAERGFLSVLVEAYCEAEALFDVPPGAFRPVPKVWSRVARLRFRAEALVADVDEELMWRVIGAGFAQRRKTILNNLRSAPPELAARIIQSGGAAAVLAAARIDPGRRAETLSVAEWDGLTRAINAFLT